MRNNSSTKPSTGASTASTAITTRCSVPTMRDHSRSNDTPDAAIAPNAGAMNQPLANVSAKAFTPISLNNSPHSTIRAALTSQNSSAPAPITTSVQA